MKLHSQEDQNPVRDLQNDQVTKNDNRFRICNVIAEIGKIVKMSESNGKKCLRNYE